jgi:hypothetical protein
MDHDGLSRPFHQFMNIAVIVEIKFFVLFNLVCLLGNLLYFNLMKVGFTLFHFLTAFIFPTATTARLPNDRLP